MGNKFVFKDSIQSADEFAFYRSKIKAALIRGGAEYPIRMEFAKICDVLESKFVAKQILFVKLRQAPNKDPVLNKIKIIQEEIDGIIAAINEQFFLEIIKGDFSR